ncbi:MAG: site-specific DNA-methyltransferase [Treponema sp.]|nr:site-specific DNA-methyltransferase [Treponema sp.]
MIRTKKSTAVYLVKTVEQAKQIGSIYLQNIRLDMVITFGLPEIDDRYHIWRLPLLHKEQTVGEVVIDAVTSLLIETKTTKKQVLEDRILGRKSNSGEKKNGSDIPKISTIRNTIGHGDSEALLRETPAESIDLVFTSPPYYNARVEYADYIDYEDYLGKMRRIIRECHRVLNEGRFFVINISPVLIRRSSRSESSKRLALPFDFHRLFIEEGFDFIDDIIWVKPEGAGWATGRGRRFAADRNPLQYKPVPVTEYVIVYRKHTDKLIDWHIRKHPDQKLVENSKIHDGYEVTNIWKIHPAHSKIHPAVFPAKLAENIISYYSFKNDVVLDPFAGLGTVGDAAVKLGRRFVLFEMNIEYINEIKQKSLNWTNGKKDMINWLDTQVPNSEQVYLNFDMEDEEIHEREEYYI